MFDSDMSNSTHTVVHFDEKGSHLYNADLLFYFAHCQIGADNNSSKRVFMTGKSYLWNCRNNNVVSVLIILLCDFITWLKCMHRASEFT